MKLLPPLAALAFGAVALAACGDDDRLAENEYSVPSERDASGYPSAQPAVPSPGTPGNPDTSLTPIRPADPDDPTAPTPGAPPPVLPPT